MCGIWGFEGKPDLETLKEAIIKADERGGHGYGFFGITKDGREHHLRCQGRVDVDIVLQIALKCVLGIGQSRLITSSDKSLHNSQPLLSDQICLVHNGNILNHEQIFELFDYRPRTDLDSEALIPMILNGSIDVDGAVIWIDKKSMRVSAYKMNMPLFSKQSKGSKYWCSKKWQY